MKKSLFRLFVFLLPILLVWAAIEFFYRTVPNNYTSKAKNFKERSAITEVLLFGTSHCFYGLNPDYFSKPTFNFSNISQTLYFDVLLFDKFAADLPNLKQVVFCIEYTNLSQKDDTDEDVYRKYYYENYMGIDVPIVSCTDPKKYSLAFTRSLKESLEIIHRYLIQGSIVDCNDDGWGNNYFQKNRIDADEVAPIRAKAHEDGSMDFSVNVKRLNHVIEICKQRNIEVVIVSLPVSKSYAAYLNKNKTAKIFQTCKDFEKNGNVRYLNLFQDQRFVDEDFYDADHLNDVGAAKASKIVNAFLTAGQVKKQTAPE